MWLTSRTIYRRSRIERLLGSRACRVSMVVSSSAVSRFPSININVQMNRASQVLAQSLPLNISITWTALLQRSDVYSNTFYLHYNFLTSLRLSSNRFIVTIVSLVPKSIWRRLKILCGVRIVWVHQTWRWICPRGDFFVAYSGKFIGDRLQSTNVGALCLSL